jgi:ATP-binding cassette subfamily B protein
MAFSLRKWINTKLERKLGDGAVDLIRRLLSENWRSQWRRWAWALLFMTITAVATAIWAWLQKDLVNSIFFEHRMDMLVPLTLAVIVLPIIRGFAGYGQEVVMSRVGNRIVADTQRRIYKHILTFGLDFFSSRPSSELIMKVGNGATSARDILNVLVVSVGRDGLTLIGLLIVMVLQAPFLLLVVAVIAPLVIVSLTRLIKRVRDIAKVEFRLLTRVIELLQETVQGARLVKTFGLAEHMNAQMDTAATAIEARSNSIAQLQAGSTPVLEAIGGAAIGLITLYCGWRTLNGTALPGEFVSFSAAMLLAYEPAKRLARLRISLEMTFVGLRMLYGILDTPPSTTEVGTDVPLEFRNGTIEFRNVSFAYRPNKPVLNNISFKIFKNSKVAIVGPSGAGKTTILSLIPRLYDVTKGTVLIDDQDVRSVSPASVRSAFAVVTQDTYMFSGTVKDNIRIGRADATDDEIRQAAVDSFAHDFISELRDGYDTNVGENGVQLSGGQRQRVAIARAILKRAPILLLDEATSSLDSQAERIVQLALDRLMESRTTIVIAHRLSTIINADRVLVVDQGTLIEQGTHRELLAKGGLYRELYEHQFADLPREAFVAPPSAIAV